MKANRTISRDFFPHTFNPAAYMIYVLYYLCIYVFIYYDMIYVVNLYFVSQIT